MQLLAECLKNILNPQSKFRSKKRRNLLWKLTLFKKPPLNLYKPHKILYYI